ncbi:putative transposase [Rhodobacter sp. 24-YEA-8]|nr:putative transposase [Rhodobacter sp. 24-YEA-8]
MPPVLVNRRRPVSQRRAGVLIGVEQRNVWSEPPPDTLEIHQEMHRIAGKRRGFYQRSMAVIWTTWAW